MSWSNWTTRQQLPTWTSRVAPDHVDSVTLRRRQHDIENATHSRGQERDCRRPVKKRGDCSGRVEYQPSGFPTPVQSLGYSNRRLVRHEVQLPLTSVCLSGPRRKSHGGRRDVPELEGNVGICLSSTGASTTRSAEDSTTSPRGHPHSSSVARSSVVRSSTATPGRLPSASSSSHRSLDTRLTAPPRPFKPEVSRVEIVGQALWQQGFSEQVAERAARPQRESTLLVYESKWRRFVGWCSQRKVDPFTASVAVVGDFLLHLFDQKLAISTLEGYRMAIANTLRATSNVEVGRCATLKGSYP